MIPVVVFSNDKIAGQLKKALSDFFITSLVSENSIDIVENSQILLLQNKEKHNAKIEGIAIFSDTCGFDIQSCSCSIAIVDNSDTKRTEVNSNTQYITCGMSGKDTITFSSIDEQEVCVSLLREVKDINNNEIEPFEVSIASRSGIAEYSSFSLLALVALLTVLGENISGKKLLLK